MNVTIDLVLVVLGNEYKKVIQMSRVPCVNEEILLDTERVFKSANIYDSSRP
jgi:hypothetical protein